MFNDSTYLVLISFILFMGVMLGGFFYHLIQYKFKNHLEKSIEATMKDYENLVSENSRKILIEFENFTELSKKLSNDTLNAQDEILNINLQTKDQINDFYEEINSAQLLRFRLENKIVKLKNMIKRLNSKGLK